MADPDPFEAISEATILACDDVPCTPEEYREGLRKIIRDLELSIANSTATHG